MKPTIYAHRGASSYAPENTMAAFQLAFQMQAEGIETDVQLTKDQIPVLFHDEHVKRTTNSMGYIKDFTYRELCQLDAGSWFSPKFTGTPIPTLEEFLTWIKSKPLYLNIELKNNKVEYNHIEAIVYEYLFTHQLINRTTISTFNADSVRKLAAYKKTVEIGFLTSRRYRHPVHVAKELGANALHLNYKRITPKIVAAATEHKMKLRLYTINRPAHLIRSIQYGVDGIFTDVPDQALYYRNLLYNR